MLKISIFSKPYPCFPSMSPFFIFLILSVTSASPLHADNVIHSSASTTHLHFYLHDTLSGPNPTAIPVVQGPTKYKGPTGLLGFGSIIVIDDVLTEGPNLTTNAIGRAQGFYSLSGLSGTDLLLSMNIVLTGGEFNGNTVAVFGRENVFESVRELPVIGGSGKFRMARGYTLIKTYAASVSTGDVVVEVDLYVSSSSSNIDKLVASSDGATSAGDASSTSSSTSVNNRLNLNVIMIILVICFFLSTHLLADI